MTLNYHGFYRLVTLEKVNGKYIYNEINNGYISNDKKKLWSGDSQHRIASITKIFAIISILILVQQKKLSLRDNLKKFNINIPFCDNITIYDLLLHRGGIFNSVNYFCDYDIPCVKKLIKSKTKNKRHYENPNIKKIIEAINDAKFAYDNIGFAHDNENNKCFYPNSDCRYNNTGYALLGHIIHIITGKLPTDFIKENILIPLKMINTTFHYKKINEPVEIFDSMENLCKFNNFDDIGIHANMISTTDDLIKFLLNYELLLNEKYLILLYDIMQKYWKCLNPKINNNFLLFHNGSIDFPPNFNEGTPSESFLLLTKEKKIIIGFGNKRNTNKISISEVLYKKYLSQ